MYVIGCVSVLLISSWLLVGYVLDRYRYLLIERIYNGENSVIKQEALKDFKKWFPDESIYDER